MAYNESLADDFVNALMIEWELVKEKYSLENVQIETLYFGGGTPSMLTKGQWKTIVERLVKKLPLAPAYEWSIECNPDSFTEEFARFWLDSGVTRLSFGIQSLDDRELRTLGRVHDARQALLALCLPLLERFKSVGADIMYGIPGQTAASLRSTLETVFSMPMVRHLSAYELAIGENTRFAMHRKLLPLPSEDSDNAMMELILRHCREHGFERYEISNYSPPGHHCRHNEAYWRQTPYIGLGPAAHSYMPPCRFSNIKSVREYLSRINNRTLAVDFTEKLGVSEIAREMIFLGLRTAQGVNEREFKAVIGLPFASAARTALLNKYIDRGMIRHEPPHWKLTDRGMLFADGIAGELF
jgi:oxygen-independent coproporphyrinogen-3 oxidase